METLYCYFCRFEFKKRQTAVNSLSKIQTACDNMRSLDVVAKILCKFCNCVKFLHLRVPCIVLIVMH